MSHVGRSPMIRTTHYAHIRTRNTHLLHPSLPSTFHAVAPRRNKSRARRGPAATTAPRSAPTTIASSALLSARARSDSGGGSGRVSWIASSAPHRGESGDGVSGGGSARPSTGSRRHTASEGGGEAAARRAERLRKACSPPCACAMAPRPMPPSVDRSRW
eukprot:scaffold28581_cov94-Isochrysis_galbana.AAC.5